MRPVPALLAVLALFAGTRSWGLLIAIPFGGLTGVAFSAPITAWSATRERENSFPMILRFVIMPLFVNALTPFSVRDLLGIPKNSLITIFATAKIIVLLPQLVDDVIEMFM